MDISIIIERKYVREFAGVDNSGDLIANPYYVQTLARMAKDGLVPGADYEGITLDDGRDITSITNVGQHEVDLNMAKLVAQSPGCDIYEARCCCGYIELLDVTATPPADLPSYRTDIDDDGNPIDFTWQSLVDQTTGLVFIQRDGRTFITPRAFHSNNCHLTASEHYTLTQAGHTIIHPDDLPAEPEGN